MANRRSNDPAVTVAVCIPTSVLAKIDEIAYNEHCSRSRVFSEILRKTIKDMEGKGDA